MRIERKSSRVASWSRTRPKSAAGSMQSMVGRVVAEQRQQFIAVGGAGDVDAAARRQSGERHRDRGDVRSRRAGQIDVGRRELERGHGTGDQPAEGFVRVRDALGFARCCRR